MCLNITAFSQARVALNPSWPWIPICEIISAFLPHWSPVRINVGEGPWSFSNRKYFWQILYSVDLWHYSDPTAATEFPVLQNAFCLDNIIYEDLKV